MVSWCLVQGCRNNNKVCKLHVLPAEPKRFQKWINILKRSDITIGRRRNYYVCHNHFSGKHKVNKPGSKCKTYLRRDAFPDMNLPDQSIYPKITETTEEEVLEESSQSDSDTNDVTLLSQSKVKLRKFCGLCSNELEAGGTTNMMTIINEEPSVRAFKVIESISTFKYREDGPQFLCATCFHNIAVIYEFQGMCNRVQKNKRIITPRPLSTLIKNKSLVVPEDAPRSTAVVKDNLEELINFEIPIVAQSSLLQELEMNKVRTDSNKEDKAKYKCKYCKGLFPDKVLHDRHLRIVHEEHLSKTKITRNLYSCPFCSISFALEESLTMHLVVHSGLMKYQ